VKSTIGFWLALALTISFVVCKAPKHEGAESSRDTLFVTMDSLRKEEIITGFSSDVYELDPEHEEFYEFMHARPFWIKDTDTLGIMHPVDMEIHNYFEVAPFLVPEAIAGTPERGAVEYIVDWMAPGEGQCMPDGSIIILWDSLPTDSQGLKAAYTPDEGFKIAKDARWDTTFTATFKARPARVFSQYVQYEWGGVKHWWEYHTDVFFERKGVVFRIQAICKAKPQFLGPESDWWRWLESHWYWMDEPHPDWSRYPIHPDSIRYEGVEDEIPPEERDPEDP